MFDRLSNNTYWNRTKTEHGFCNDRSNRNPGAKYLSRMSVTDKPCHLSCLPRFFSLLCSPCKRIEESSGRFDSGNVYLSSEAGIEIVYNPKIESDRSSNKNCAEKKDTDTGFQILKISVVENESDLVLKVSGKYISPKKLQILTQIDYQSIKVHLTSSIEAVLTKYFPCFSQQWGAAVFSENEEPIDFFVKKIKIPGKIKVDYFPDVASGTVSVNFPKKSFLFIEIPVFNNDFSFDIDCQDQCVFIDLETKIETGSAIIKKKIIEKINLILDNLENH